MLFTNNFTYLCNGLLLLMLFLFICAGYAYRINAHRSDDDPAKRTFHFSAIWLAPITWPMFLFAFLILFVIRIFMYMLVLVLFTIGLMAIRKPFLFVWLD